MAEPKAKGRFTAEDMQLMRLTFKDNEPLLKLLRKIFLPVHDETTPIGQINGIWAEANFEEMNGDQAKVFIVAYQQLVKKVEFYIAQIKTLANETEPTEQDRRKDSAK